MRRCMLILVLAGSTAAAALPATAAAQDPRSPAESSATGFTRFTPEQLRDLVAPIALYADPLLAQVLLAATFPDQVAAAAAYVQSNGTEGIDDQYWDVSVKAVAHYPTVLNLLNTRPEWMASLGQAYAAQSSDVMAAVQQMRRMARSQGNLESTPEQEVVADADYVRIWPAQPQFIYVPVYDPAVIFYRPVFVRPGFHAFFSFGVPFAIGPWLIYDWDWPGHRIYYTGWYGGGWIARSRPFISITNVYVNPMHRRVWYDRDILRRHVDYGRAYPYRYSGSDGRRSDGAYRDDGPRYTGRNAQPRDGQRTGTPAVRDGQRRGAAPGNGLGPTQPTVQPTPRTPQRSPWSGGGPVGQQRPDRGEAAQRAGNGGAQPAPPTPWNAGSELTAVPASDGRAAHQRGSAGNAGRTYTGDLPRTQYGTPPGLPRTEYGTPRSLPRTEYGTPRDLPRTEYGAPRERPRSYDGASRSAPRESPRSYGGGQNAQRDRGSAPRSEPAPRQESGNRNGGDQGGRGAHRR